MKRTEFASAEKILNNAAGFARVGMPYVLYFVSNISQKEKVTQ